MKVSPEWRMDGAPCARCNSVDLPRVRLATPAGATYALPLCPICLADGMQAATGWAVRRSVEMWRASRDVSRQIKRERGGL